MTTYRIRPLVWTAYRSDRDDEYWAKPIWSVMYVLRKHNGFWHTSGAAPHAPYESIDAAKAACESHWRGVLEAALEPVEAQ